MTRLYTRNRDGARLHEAAPGGHWKILTVLGAPSTRGILAVMTILDHVLCPQLRPGEVVMMDNLSAHKVNDVRASIEAAGEELLYLPPYSPDLKPVEKAWSKLKTLLRSAKARTREALDQDISALLPQLTPDNAQAWFRTRFGTL